MRKILWKFNGNLSTIKTPQRHFVDIIAQHYSSALGRHRDASLQLILFEIYKILRAVNIVLMPYIFNDLWIIGLENIGRNSTRDFGTCKTMENR